MNNMNVYLEPNLESKIICTVTDKDELVIDLKNSTEEFYKVWTVFGAEGFCYKHRMCNE